MGLVYLALVIAAGLLSSGLAQTGAEVLLKPENCGWLAVGLASVENRATPGRVTENALEATNALVLSARWSYIQSLQYTRSCYSNASESSLLLCDRYVVRSILSSKDRSAPCPFQEGECLTRGITMDSGLIDSNSHLGINAPDEDRVQIRKIISCAVVPLDARYGTEWIEPQFGEKGGLRKYFYLGEGHYGPEKLNITYPYSFQLMDASEAGVDTYIP